MLGENSDNPFLQKLEALAFCRSNDAVKLAFLDKEDIDRIDSMDLSALTELHRVANGSIELKLIDRSKLLQLLAEIEAGSRSEQTAELVRAIRQAADRLPERTGTVTTDDAP